MGELLLLLEEHGHLLLLFVEIGLGRVLEPEVLHLELLELKKSLILTLEPLELLARIAHLLAVGGTIGRGRRSGHGHAGGGGHLARLEISDLPAHGSNFGRAGRGGIRGEHRAKLVFSAGELLLHVHAGGGDDGGTVGFG